MGTSHGAPVEPPPPRKRNGKPSKSKKEEDAKAQEATGQPPEAGTPTAAAPATNGSGGVNGGVGKATENATPKYTSDTLVIGRPTQRAPAFQDLLAAFREELNVTPEFENAIRVVYGTIMSQKIPGDPVWLHLVGPSGSGKTEILMSAADSPQIVWKDALTQHTLISGFSLGKEDPSLLPKLNGKTFILKDLTEVLSMPKNIKDEIFSVLRGAYDGQAERSFGNGQTRSYKTDFTLIAGVTAAIFRERNSSMGERFLVYHMHKGRSAHNSDTGTEGGMGAGPTTEGDGTFDDAIIRAMANVGRETAMRGNLRSVAADFLARPVDPRNLPDFPGVYSVRLAALASIVAILRGQVDRDQFSDRLHYRPQAEAGTRVAKQLKKLLLGLSLLEEPYTITEAAYTLVVKVALDSCVAFNFDILRSLLRSREPMKIDEIQRAADIPMSTLRLHLDEMLLLGALQRQRIETGQRGQPPYLYIVHPALMGLWNKAGIDLGKIR